ncbi:VWA domain-containing protein [Acidobacteria bacterium AH-259-D05]|nr:VWA domain-containing protein [Acidobacteria bacterium AH-259-D05]
MKTYRWKVLTGMLPLVLILTGVVAQDKEREDEEAPFRVEVDAVNVLTTVHDKDTRKFVTDLTKEDFQIYEDGVLQVVTNFTQQTDLPLTIGLCVDTSSSVRLKLPFEKEAAIDFLYAVMRPSDKVLLVEFDTGVTLIHDFTSNPNDLVREINQLKAGGGTSLYDAIYLVAEQKMLNQKGRKTVVILSDGADLTSKHTFEETLRMAYQAEITIYAVSTTRFGADIDHEGDNALKQLTESTGGRAFFPYSTSQLTEAFREVDQELRSQYNLTYVPSNKIKDGAFRQIKVKVSRDKVNFRHRKGYFAPLEKSSGDS